MASTNARLSARALDLLYDRRVQIGGVILNRSTVAYKEYASYGYGDYYLPDAQPADSSKAATEAKA